MLKITLGKNKYSFPEKWHELKPDQYLALCRRLFEYANGKLAVDELKAKFFCDIIGIEFKKRDNENDLLWENIYRLSREFTFFLKIDYKADLKPVDLELRRKLRKFSPDEIYTDDPVIKWVRRQKYKYSIDAVFAKNLLPSIMVGEQKVYGYRFELNGSLLKTTMTAQQFINASMALDAYDKSHKDKDLNLLMAILYNKDNPDYFNKVDPVIRFAVLLNYQAIMAFITRKTKYSIIWHRGKKQEPKKEKNTYAVGAADSIYSLAKLGYGSIDDLSNYNLVRYLDLLLKNIVDSAHMLKDNDFDLAKISEHTGLSIELINQII